MSSASEAELSACNSCGQTAEALGGVLRKCTACAAVCYCSIECQRADWRAGHKANCGKMKMNRIKTTRTTGGGKKPGDKPSGTPSAGADVECIEVVNKRMNDKDDASSIFGGVFFTGKVAKNRKGVFTIPVEGTLTWENFPGMGEMVQTGTFEKGTGGFTNTDGTTIRGTGRNKKTYKGAHVVSVPNGKGVETWIDSETGTTCRLQGTFVRGLLQGEGTWVNSNKDILTGNFVDSKPAGRVKVMKPATREVNWGTLVAKDGKTNFHGEADSWQIGQSTMINTRFEHGKQMGAMTHVVREKPGDLTSKVRGKHTQTRLDKAPSRDWVCAVCTQGHVPVDWDYVTDGTWFHPRGTYQLKCGHAFHGDCLMQWFNTDAPRQAKAGNVENGVAPFKCPTCRKNAWEFPQDCVDCEGADQRVSAAGA